MHRLILSALGALLLVIAAPLAAQNTGLEIEARLWSPSVSGDVQVTERGLGTSIDIEDDLGFKDDEFVEGRLTWRATKRSKLRVAYTPIQYHGDNVVSRSIVFGGRTFSFSERVVSDLDLEYGRVGWAWQFLANRDRTMRLGPIVEIKAFRGSATLAAPDRSKPISETKDFEAAFGSAGLALDIERGTKLHIFSEMTMLVGTGQGDVTDLEAGLEYRLLKTLWVTGGYRSLKVDAKEGDDTLNFDLDGIFFGAALRF